MSDTPVIVRTLRIVRKIEQNKPLSEAEQAMLDRLDRARAAASRISRIRTRNEGLRTLASTYPPGMSARAVARGVHGELVAYQTRGSWRRDMHKASDLELFTSTRERLMWRILRCGKLVSEGYVREILAG